jgi:hypothetical protein
MVLSSPCGALPMLSNLIEGTKHARPPRFRLGVNHRPNVAVVGLAARALALDVEHAFKNHDGAPSNEAAPARVCPCPFLSPHRNPNAATPVGVPT